jgi:hypothetical protein
MRKVLRPVLALALLGASWGSWSATPGTGNDLIRACRAEVNGMDTGRDSGWLGGYCTGLVSGVADSLGGFRFCRPEGSTYGQFTRIVYKYLQEHPENLQLPDSALVIRALAAGLPCPSKP